MFCKYGKLYFYAQSALHLTLVKDTPISLRTLQIQDVGSKSYKIFAGGSSTIRQRGGCCPRSNTRSREGCRDRAIKGRHREKLGRDRSRDPSQDRRRDPSQRSQDQSQDPSQRSQDQSQDPNQRCQDRSQDPSQRFQDRSQDPSHRSQDGSRDHGKHGAELNLKECAKSEMLTGSLE